ncbi:hypothetical protein [Polaromonas sp.]|uniref:hypothetical protein n=1 Tax=Polaromonas sp. TaxID=1869339 RepID=UPI0027320724|nr:hypothetical protein [Polaromonas sp.]MDP1886658.1 hypothetical protein [Polaromonas sp.]
MTWWTRKAPKEPGYYWFLPSRTRVVWQRQLTEQEAPTVMCLDEAHDWSYVGNEVTLDASELNGRWWPVALQPPPLRKGKK